MDRRGATGRVPLTHRRLPVWVAGALVALLAFWLVPVVGFDDPTSPVVFDRDGRLMDASVAADEQWRFPDAGPVPPRFASALVAFEDRRFRWHPGVDPVAIVRAVRDNLAAGHVVSGGSTLTMQVVRLSRGNPPRTLAEKLVEAVLALRLDAACSKEEILALYAAHAPFGGNTVGLEAASWRYYGRAPGELSWAEAAALAVLPNSPSLVHPGRNRDALRSKRDRLLERLAASGQLTSEDLHLARAEPLPGAPRPLPSLAPHLRERAAQLGTHAVERRVHTTLDSPLQRRALEVTGLHQARLADDHIYDLAALIVDVPTGEVRAYVGNVTRGDEGAPWVDVARAPRSTGSLLKPFLYGSMLDGGELLPHELVADVPLRIGGFAPENFDRSYLGAIPASEALARSRNVPAVRLLRDHGLERFAEELRQLGMTTLHRPAADYGLTLVLGGAEGTLWELTGLYRDLALSALEARGPPMRWRGPADAPRDTVLGAEAAWLTLGALEWVHRPGVQASWRRLAGSRRVAWKTGTSFGFRDAWAIGVTPQVVVAVWAGNASGEGRPHLTGLRAAAPVLFSLLELTEGGPWFDEPSGLQTVVVCAHSGMRAGPDCPTTVPQRVPPSALGARACTWCQRIHLDDDGWRVHAGCALPSARHPVSRFVLPPGLEWYTLRHRADLAPLPAWRADCRPAAPSTGGLSLIVPREGAELYVPLELDGRRGHTVLRAAHRDPRAEIYWHLDDAYLGATSGLHELAIAPAPGEHLLTLVDAAGARLERRFTVLERSR